MGCNTSNESVPQSERENADGKEETAGQNKQEKGGGDTVDNNSKPASAKTVTLTSNGALISGADGGGDITVAGENKSSNSGKQSSKGHQPNKTGEKQEKKTEGENLEGAATKIQAAFRGHQARQSMKQPVNKQAEIVVNRNKSANAQPHPEEVSKSDEADLSNAATKIQASFRGHLARKQMDKKETETSSKQEKKQENEEELDVDLTDPELNKAAVKIQASFRGHMVRKEQEEEEAAAKEDKKK